METIRVNPDLGVAWSNAIQTYAYLNRLDDAKRAYRETVSRKLDGDTAHMNRYGVAFLEGDRAEMQRQLAWGTGKAGTEDFFFSYESDTKAYFGRLAEARAATRRAIDSARRSGEKETAAQWQLNGAIREAEFGNSDRARQEAASAQTLASARDLKILAALVLARSGHSAEAQKIGDALEKENPLNTMIIGYWLPTIRASVEINHRNADKAEQMLQVSAPYDLASPNPAVEFGSFLYPIFVRGEAFLLMHRGADAAAEFQNFVNNRGIVASSPLGAFVRLQLGRAYAMQGDSSKAKDAYNDFLTLWKDADPDIPILKQAKAEYAKLQ